MAKLYIELQFSKIKSHEQLVASFVDLRRISAEDQIQIVLDLDCTPIHCDYLALLVAYLKLLDDAGIPYTIDLSNFNPASTPVQYAAEIGFFRHLEMSVEPSEKQMRHVSRSSNIVQFYDSADVRAANEMITANITENTSLNKSFITLVNYALDELMHNAISHAGASTGGFVVTHYAPFRGELRVMVCDTGTGLHNTLSWAKSPKPGLHESKTLNRIKEFVIANQGELLIHSGCDIIKIISGRTTIQQSSHWQGTYVFMRLKTENATDYQRILEAEDVVVDGNKGIPGKKHELEYSHA